MKNATTKKDCVFGWKTFLWAISIKNFSGAKSFQMLFIVENENFNKLKNC